MKTTVPIIYRHLITSAMGSDSLDASTASSRRGNLRRRHLQEFCGECIFGGGESCEERAQSLVRWTSSNLDTGWTLERAKSSVLNDWDDCAHKDTSSDISNGVIVGIVFGIMAVLLCVLGLFAKRRFDSRDEVKDAIRETAPPDSNDEPPIDDAPAPAERKWARKPGKRISFAMDDEPDPSSGDNSNISSEPDYMMMGSRRTSTIKPKLTSSETMRARKPGKRISFAMDDEPDPSSGDNSNIADYIMTYESGEPTSESTENEKLYENTEAEINPNDNGRANSDAVKNSTGGTASNMPRPQDMEESKYAKPDKINGETAIESVEPTSKNPENEKLYENTCESKEPSSSDDVENGTKGTASDMHSPQDMEESKYAKPDKINRETAIESVEPTSKNPEKEKLDENTCESKEPSSSYDVENGTEGTANDMHVMGKQIDTTGETAYADFQKFLSS